MHDPDTAASRSEFDREAAAYDTRVAETMPGYTELHDMLIWGIPFLPTRAFRLLELGVGTGTLTGRLLETFPHATLTGIDLSPKMIALARRKLRPFKDRVELLQSHLAEFDLPGPFDAVVSSLAIHHLTNPEKTELFRKLRALLPPGGYFGDADDHLPEDPVFDSRFSQIAEQLARQHRTTPTSGALQRAWHEHEQFDRPAPLSFEVEALERSGFSHVDVPWRFFGQAVVWAYR